jgi:Na+/proline symporter
VRVLGLLGLFYIYPGIYGALGRVLAPQLYVTGATDTVVLRLPQAAWPGTVGNLLGAITAAGAFAAFLSTSSGLLVSIAGTISHDVWPRVSREKTTTVAIRRLRFRLGAVLGMLAPVAVAFVAQGVDIAVLVGWAFALAASTFCPLFLLGIWWTRLTAAGAGCGMVAGALVATSGILVGLALGEPSGVAGDRLGSDRLPDHDRGLAARRRAPHARRRDARAARARRARPPGDGRQGPLRLRGVGHAGSGVMRGASPPGRKRGMAPSKA